MKSIFDAMPQMTKDQYVMIQHQLGAPDALIESIFENNNGFIDAEEEEFYDEIDNLFDGKYKSEYLAKLIIEEAVASNTYIATWISMIRESDPSIVKLKETGEALACHVSNWIGANIKIPMS